MIIFQVIYIFSSLREKKDALFTIAKKFTRENWPNKRHSATFLKLNGHSEQAKSKASFRPILQEGSEAGRRAGMSLADQR